MNFCSCSKPRMPSSREAFRQVSGTVDILVILPLTSLVLPLQLFGLIPFLASFLSLSGSSGPRRILHCLSLKQKFPEMFRNERFSCAFTAFLASGAPWLLKERWMLSGRELGCVFRSTDFVPISGKVISFIPREFSERQCGDTNLNCSWRIILWLPDCNPECAFSFCFRKRHEIHLHDGVAFHCERAMRVQLQNKQSDSIKSKWYLY